MSKHTPGPWINSQAWGKRLSFRRIISDTPHVSVVVADVPDDPTTSARTRHANARLIAAAPEMLSMLIKAEDYLRDVAGAPVLANECKAIIEKARKSEG